MMKNYTILILLNIVMLVSCEGYLNTHPSNAKEGKEAIRTEEDIAAALNGAYDGLTKSKYYGADFLVYGEVKGEDVQPCETKQITESAYRFSWLEINVPDEFWLIPYEVICQANFLLQEIEKGVVEESAYVKHAKGQALALRALCHFDLLLTFGYPYLKDEGKSLGVPYVRKVLLAEDFPARQSVKEGYRMIISDLEDAILLLDDKIENGYINKWAAKALLARVYLYKGDWDAAFDYAEDIIEHGPYELVKNDKYIASWGETYTTESIFDLSISDLAATNKNLIGYLASPQGYAAMIATQEFLNLMNEDKRDVRLNLLKYDTKTEKWFIQKYPGRKGQLSVNNIKVVRLSEIYLLAAEAALKKTVPEQIKADFYLNAIRQRANPLLESVVATEELVLKERRKELVMEGYRFFDAMRIGKKIKREGGFHFLNNTDLVCPSWEDYRIILPIPQAEINANPNIREYQNPGY